VAGGNWAISASGSSKSKSDSCMKNTVRHNVGQYSSSWPFRGLPHGAIALKQMFELREKLDFFRPNAANSRP
jgi:hypothetical protein